MITVKTTTGTVQVGGEFNRALGQIKAINGRKFDSSTKTWSVPISAKELKAKVTLPIEMPNGDHVTRYGNTYSHGEWQAEQEYKAVSVSHDDARQAVRQWLEEELSKWIAADKVSQIASIIESTKLSALIENGTIRATAEKIAALYAIETGYYKRMEAVYQAEDAEAEMQRDAIAAKYGQDW